MANFSPPRRLIAAFAVLLAALSVASPQLHAQDAAAAPAELVTSRKIQEVAAKLRPSLVRIHVVEAVDEDGRETKGESFGSGAIISEDGYVVTNHHVAGKARWLSVTLGSREEVEAKLIGTDPLADIAVIKLAAPAPGKSYTAAQWGDSSRLQVGDPVLAMGSPLAFSQSVTAGIVSNTELILPPQTTGGAMLLDGEDVGSIVRWIAHDARILPGNSGGPLVNLDGEIVGVNEIQVGLSGAIPGNLARAVAQQIIKNGSVTRSFTGLDLQPRLRQNPADSGVLVGGVMPESPAAKAGIRAGDVLLQIGDTDLEARFNEQIPVVNQQLADLAVGTPIRVRLRRGQQETTVTLTPTRRDAAEAVAREISGWGITASDITPVMAREERLPGTGGVYVTGVLTGGPAGNAKPSLEEGDVLLQVNKSPVNSVADLEKQTASFKKSPDGVMALVELYRDGQRLLTVVPVYQENTEDTSVTVAKAWLPIEVQVVTRPLAAALSLPETTRGVRVTQIYNSFPEAKLLQVGDVITAVDDQALELEQPEEADQFAALLRQYKIGTPVKLRVMRAGAPQTVSVTLPRAPRRPQEQPRYVSAEIGVTLRGISFQDVARGDAAPGDRGAVVVDVTGGSWAALAGLRPGDIVRQIDSKPITDLETARAALEKVEQAKPRYVTFFIERGVHTQFIEVQTDGSLTDPSVKTSDSQTTRKENLP